MTHVRQDLVPILTVVGSMVSLALVFGAAGGAIPSSVVPEPPSGVLDAIPTVNAVISVTAMGTIGLGWYWIRVGDVHRHRLAMLTSVALFAAFLVLYLYRLVAIGGATAFSGPETVYRFVYLPVLAVHIGLAVVCIPMLYYVLFLAASHSVGDLRETSHATIGRIAAPLWLTSFALGLVVYVLLYGL